MFRISIAILLACGVLLGAAVAEDDMWDDDRIINDETAIEPDVSEVRSPGDMNDPSYWGPYFGTGDEYTDGNVTYVGGAGYTGWPYGMRPSRTDGAYPEYMYENVFGPMWGVPTEALIDMGYDPDLIAHMYFGDSTSGDGDYYDDGGYDEEAAAQHTINRAVSEDDRFYD